MIPVMGYKYNMVGKGNTIHIYMCSEEVLCPVATWQWWTQLTTNICHHSRDKRITFQLSLPYTNLSPD